MSSEHFQTIPGSTPSTFGALNTRVQRSEKDMDLVINGNKCDSNVTKGQYVSVRNSTISGITDGIYQADANVASGTAFVAANLTVVTAGGLNELSSKIESLSDQIGRFAPELIASKAVAGELTDVSFTLASGKVITDYDLFVINVYSADAYRTSAVLVKNSSYTDKFVLPTYLAGTLYAVVIDLNTMKLSNNIPYTTIFLIYGIRLH